jgi:hypothetical protein
MKATAFFANDPSVGINPSYYEMELPFNELIAEDREEIRELIRKFYTELNNESKCSWVGFSDEKIED